MSGEPCSLQRLCGRNNFLPLPAFVVCQHSSACGYISPVFKVSVFKTLSVPASHCVCQIPLCLFPIGILMITLRSHLDNSKSSPHLKILKLFLQSPFFTPIESNMHRFQELEPDNSGGHCLAYYSGCLSCFYFSIQTMQL